MLQVTFPAIFQGRAFCSKFKKILTYLLSSVYFALGLLHCCHVF